MANTAKNIQLIIMLVEIGRHKFLYSAVIYRVCEV